MFGLGHLITSCLSLCVSLVYITTNIKCPFLFDHQWPPPFLEPLPTIAIWSIGSTRGNVGEYASLEALVNKLDQCLQPEFWSISSTGSWVDLEAGERKCKVDWFTHVLSLPLLLPSILPHAACCASWACIPGGLSDAHSNSDTSNTLGNDYNNNGNYEYRGCFPLFSLPSPFLILPLKTPTPISMCVHQKRKTRRDTGWRWL